MGYCWVGVVKKTVLGSTHVVEQLLFTVVPSILTFYFDLILGSFFTFLGLIDIVDALSFSFEFLWWWWWLVGGFQRLLSLNPSTVLVVLLLGFWSLLGCDN